MSEPSVCKAERISITKGEILFQRGDNVENVCLLISGQVTAKNDYLTLSLESGALIGIIDAANSEYMFDYIADTEITVLMYAFSRMADVKKVFSMGKSYQELTMTSVCMQFSKLYDVYKSRFAVYAKDVKAFSKASGMEPPEETDILKCTYLAEIAALEKRAFHELFSGSEIIAYMHIMIAAEQAKNINGIAVTLTNVLHEESSDADEEEAVQADDVENISEPQSETLQVEVAADGTLAEPEAQQRDMSKVLWELAGATGKILTYAEFEQDRITQFESLLEQYRESNSEYRVAPDLNLISIRKKISEYFYEAYEKVFLKTRKESQIDRLLEMFLSFGFMDERDFEQEVLADLYYFRPQMTSEKYNVFTVYDWLRAIYNGDREPSKNEYDMDYKEYFRELKRTKHFTAEEERNYFSDQKQKVQFEITNFIRIASRLSSGEPTSFCPVLSQKSLFRSVGAMFVSTKRISDALDQILDVDYSLFHREQMYYDESRKIGKILIMTKVLPDIILMPNAGTRGMMWQEISEKKRNTPARFVLPGFSAEDINKLMIHMAAAFRWDMCRTIQGGYWNDIRELSLTSEYSDYVQFYKKNRELSEDTKEKVKAQYKSCRNSNREMFAKDYEEWIRYEANGMMRLNKVTRRILFRYCPLSVKYLDKVKNQPAYAEFAAQHTMRCARKAKEVNAFIVGVQRKNGEVTRELEENLAFYEQAQ